MLCKTEYINKDKNEKKTIFNISKSAKEKLAKPTKAKSAKEKSVSLKTPKVMNDKFVPIPLLSGDTELLENKIKDIKRALKLSQDIESKGRELLIKGLAAIVDFEHSKTFEHPTRIIIDNFFKEF